MSWGTKNCSGAPSTARRSIPREVVRACLRHHASAVILAHNHPSGVAEPSRADRDITRTLIDALRLMDIRVLDHLVIGHGEPVSMASRGLL